MKISITVENRKHYTHFGHAPRFAIFEVDDLEKEIVSQSELSSPPHEPGVLPEWLAQHGVTTIIAGGIGSRARERFEQKGIDLMAGAPADKSRTLVELYLSGKLNCGGNICDH